MKRELRPYLVLAFLIILLDQLSKYIIRYTLIPGESIQVLGDYLKFTLIYNQGGAFGIVLGSYFFYTMMALIASVIIVIYMVKTEAKDKIALLILSIVLGGALGNLIDRIAFKRVVDFIDVDMPDIIIPPFSILSFHFGGYQIWRWYIFNIADAALTVGLASFIVYLMIKDFSSKKEAEKSAASATPENE